MALKQVLGGEDHAWGADAALGATLFEKALLDGSEAAFDRDAFDGGEICPFDLKGRDEAGIDEVSVEQDGAGPALAFAAALLGSGETEILAKDVEETLHGRHGDGPEIAVYGALERDKV